MLLLSLLPLAAPGLLGGLHHAPRARSVGTGLAWVHLMRAGGVSGVDSVGAGVGGIRPVRTRLRRIPVQRLPRLLHGVGAGRTTPYRMRA